MANEFKIKKGLIVQGSGSTILDIQGSQGQLFSVTDELSGSLFSVNDISGLPILQVSSNDSVKLGTFNAEAIKVLGTTTTIASGLIVTGSVTAASAIARGANLSPTLVASANGDMLVGLDINPTFTNGAFTGVTTLAIRVTGNISANVDNTYINGLANAAWAKVRSRVFECQTGDVSLNTVGAYNTTIGSNSTEAIKIFNSTRNIVIQNGGTFIDDGVNRLQVSGSVRITNNLTVSGSLTTKGAFYDSSNSPGTTGNVLTSVGTGTQWTGVTGTGFGLTVAMTLGLQNIF